MLLPAHVREHVVLPVLARLGAIEPRLNAPAAIELLMGTWVTESTVDGDSCLVQLGGGPALGLWQMEPRTHADHRAWLARRPDLREAIDELAPVTADASAMITCLNYACAMARIHYWRRPEPLPSIDDIDGLAAYWKQWFNTPRGKGDPQKWARDYRRYCLALR